VNRFAFPGEKNVLFPRLDPIDDTRRLDPNAPVLEAYLGGRRVLLARPDPKTRRPGMPVDLTIPLSVSRYRYARDIERDRATMPFEPTPIVGFEQDTTPLWAALAVAGAIVGLTLYLAP